LPPPLVLLGGYTLGVENDELVAKKGSQRLKKGQLVGSIILVQVELGLVLPVTILGYESVPSWADGGAPIAAYTLVYPEVASLLGVKNVCGGSLLEPLVSAATVLGGETYDDATKTVNANQTGWFTLACAGSAAAKMKLMGYAPQTNFPGTSAPSTPDRPPGDAEDDHRRLLRRRHQLHRERHADRVGEPRGHGRLVELAHAG
jgi:hypothetical protein